MRDDIHSGSPHDPNCPAAEAKLAPDAAHYLVVDTNVVLQQVICKLMARPWYTSCRIESPESVDEL